MGEAGLINGGFFVLDGEALDDVAEVGDDAPWERAPLEPLEPLAVHRQPDADKPDGFWHPVDTLCDKIHLDDLWWRGAAAWQTW